MDFRGWMPPEIAVGLTLIAVFGGSWVLFGLWWLFQHVTIAWH